MDKIEIFGADIIKYIQKDCCGHIKEYTKDDHLDDNDEEHGHSHHSGEGVETVESQDSSSDNNQSTKSDPVQ